MYRNIAKSINFVHFWYLDCLGQDPKLVVRLWVCWFRPVSACLWCVFVKFMVLGCRLPVPVRAKTLVKLIQNQMNSNMFWFRTDKVQFQSLLSGFGLVGFVRFHVVYVWFLPVYGFELPNSGFEDNQKPSSEQYQNKWILNSFGSGRRGAKCKICFPVLG